MKMPFTPRLHALLMDSQSIAARHGDNYVGLFHVLAAMADPSNGRQGIASYLAEHGVTANELAENFGYSPNESLMFYQLEH